MKANIIVSTIKRQRVEVLELFADEDIDFVGCSENYCKEKIDYLIFALQNLKKHLRAKDTAQRKRSEQ